MPLGKRGAFQSSVKFGQGQIEHRHSVSEARGLYFLAKHPPGYVQAEVRALPKFSGTHSLFDTLKTVIECGYFQWSAVHKYWLTIFALN